MSDDGFNFQPVERREAKRFEPPPWEQDKFDELARQRAEREALAADEAEAASAQAAPARVDAESVGAATETETPVADGASSRAAAETASEPRADDARVEQMLAELAAEEPKATSAYWKTNVIVGSVLVVFGSVFLIWGMAALVGARSTGAVGAFGGSVVLLFGAGFVFGGLYVAVKSLRQRGVL